MHAILGTAALATTAATTTAAAAAAVHMYLRVCSSPIVGVMCSSTIHTQRKQRRGLKCRYSLAWVIDTHVRGRGGESERRKKGRTVNDSKKGRERTLNPLRKGRSEKKESGLVFFFRLLY